MVPSSVSTQRTAVELAVGAVQLHLEARDPALRGPLNEAFVGYDPGDARAAISVDVALDLGAAPAPGLPELPQLALTDDGGLVDDSEGWTLRISPLRDGRASAVAHLRRWREEPALWRLQVAGLARVVAATLAPDAAGALVHGCAMVAPGGERAVLFIGGSGDGKTTMARRLLGWTALSDDTAWIGRAGDGWTVAGTPFAGKERLPRSGRAVPLTGIFTLAPSTPLAVTRVETGPAFFELVSRTMWFAPGWGGTQRLWDLLAELGERVPLWRLASRLEDEVAPALAAALEGPC